MLKHLLTPEAEEDLEEAAAYYESREPGLGAAFLNEYSDGIDRILAFPESHTQLSQDVRRILLKRFTYQIIYSIEHQLVLILSVAYTKRKPRNW